MQSITHIRVEPLLDFQTHLSIHARKINASIRSVGRTDRYDSIDKLVLGLC
jgi:hypothetical protein